MGIIDIVILSLFLVFMIIGYIKGFLKQLFLTFGWIVALVTATLLSKPAGNIMLGTSIGTKFTSTIFEWIASKGEIFTTVIPEFSSEHMSSALTNLDIPTFLHEFIIKMVDLSSYHNMSLADVIAPKIVTAILCSASFALIFIIVLIIVKVLAKLSSKIVKGSALGFFDGLLGAAWGGVKVTIFVSLVMLGLSFLSTLPYGQEINTWLANDMRLMDDSFGIGKIFFEHNPLLYIINLIPFFKK